MIFSSRDMSTLLEKIMLLKENNGVHPSFLRKLDLNSLVLVTFITTGLVLLLFIIRIQ